MEFQAEWINGFRLGLWYHDLSEMEDEAFNLGIALDLGFIEFIIYVNPKEDHPYFDEE